MSERLTSNPVRVGMVGGGRGAFIGGVHRHAIALDGEGVLAAGAFSSDPTRAMASGEDLGLPSGRVYSDWRRMLESERAMDPARRIEVVSIVTPNDTHAEIATAALEAGFVVVVDKPMTRTAAEAESLAAVAEACGGRLWVTYNYSGYPMVRELKDRVARGDLGVIRKVFVEYHQGWLATSLELDGHKQASWRTDPARAGAGGSLGDIGSHAEHLLRFVTGLSIERLSAQTTSFGAGRVLDDDAAVLLELSGGARGVLTCSQVCVGEQNGLSIRVYGDRGAARWRQESPEQLWTCGADGVWTVISRGAGDGPSSQSASRLPGGHPEGFIEAFANIYRGAFASTRGEASTGPSASDGLAGLRFVEAAVRSGQDDGRWIELSR